MWGATGIKPWPHTWAEYKRMFLGWRRQRWEFFGTLCVAVANGLLPRTDRRPWQASDFTVLVKPAPRWRKRKKKGGVDALKMFCDGTRLVNKSARPARKKRRGQRDDDEAGGGS